MGKNSYDENSIKRLSFPESVRRRPGTYVGGKDKDSVYRLFKEVLDNAIDEYQTGHNDTICIWWWKDKVFVGDNGRGIPVKKHPTEKISTLDVVFTSLHAGGKFDTSSYKISCFTGKTKIRLLDGKDRSLKWLEKNYKNKKFWVYSCGSKGALHPGLAHSPRITGKVHELIEVTLDNGKKERCTKEHLWKLRNGSYCEAQNLKVGSSLMPLYLKEGKDGYTYHQPNYLTKKQSWIRGEQLNYKVKGGYERNRKDRAYIPVHRVLACDMFKEYKSGMSLHHKNRNKKDNRPINCDVLSKKDHLWEHNNDEGVVENRKISITKYNKSKRGRKESRKNGLKYGCNNLLKYISTEEHKEEKRKFMHTRNSLRKNQLKNVKFKIIKHVNNILNQGIEVTEYNFDSFKPYRNFPILRTCLTYFKDFEDMIRRAKKYITPQDRFKRKNNHKVIKIRIIKLKKPIKVYDITVEKYHNFALSSGVFVHNSGLNGIGIKATNALSDITEVYTRREDKWYYQKYSRGIKVNDKPKVSKKPSFLKGVKNINGTIIGFSPDLQIMSTKRVDLPRLLEEVEDISILCPNLRITVYNMEKKKKKVFLSKGGIREYVSEEYSSTFHKSPFYSKSKGDGIEVCLLWTNEEEEEVYSYVNCSYTDEGGTHITGLDKAVSSVLKRYGSDIEPSDLRAGMSGTLHIRMSEPQYQGQTKNKLTNKETEKEVFDFIKSELDIYFKKNVKVAKHIIKRAKILKSARNKASVAKMALKSVTIVSKDKKGILPSKLIEATDCTSKERELFIVEGDSAGKTTVLGREAKFQEVLKLKGKINNAITTKQSKLFAKKTKIKKSRGRNGEKETVEESEIHAIVTAVGTHIGQKQKIKNCRYDKIMILADADPDGKHIEALVISFFVRFMSDVIKAGKLYLVKSPLFVGYCNNKRVFGSKMDIIRKKFPKNANIQFSRLKGHGEVNPDEIWDYALNPKTRKLIQVKWKGSIEKTIEEIMGSDSAPRKKLLGIEVEE